MEAELENKMASNVIPLKPITRMSEVRPMFGESDSTVRRKLQKEPDYPKPFEINAGGGLAFWTHELIEYYSKKPRINRYRAE